MSITCPKCGCVNRSRAKTCALCGLQLEGSSFEELFGPPKQLQGRYAIGRTVSQGQVVSLYEAVDQQEANRPCLVQEMATFFLDWRDRDEVKERFSREVAVWQALHHPNIARITDAFADQRRLYLVTESVEGVSLQAIVDDRLQQPSEPTLLLWARQLCAALDYLHSQRPPIVLGYLSPAAIQIDPAGDAKLVDFGLARFLQSRPAGGGAPTRGVRGYEAPEQRQGQLTPRSDIYSLGIVLYAVATHHDPTERPLPALRHRAPHLSEAATKVIARAYRRDPTKRYASAAEMQDALVSLGEPVTLSVRLSPFVLAEGQEASSLRDLLRLCATNWDDGLRALVNGHIEDWLRESAQSLRAAGQSVEAQEIEGAARRTAQVREELTRTASRPGREEIAHHAAFAAWLQEMGATGIQPRLEVQPQGFDFGELPPRMKGVAKIQIRNAGQGYLNGHVESPFPWITVPQPVFGCRAGDTAEVEVVARGRRLPAGEFRSPQVILVTSNGGQAWLEARARSSQPELAVAPSVLDFGPVTRSGAHMAHLTLSNRGGGMLSGQVVSRVPWLRVRRSAFRCPAGASARIAVELLGGQIPPQAADATHLRRALIVDSEGGQATIDVAWTWARPSLALDTTALDFGPTRRGARIERMLTLSNPGTADLVGQVHSQVDWLEAQPAEFRCPPGETQIIQVVCDTSHLPGGDTLAADAIRIDANAGQQVLSAAVEVLAPELVIEPTLLELGTVHDGDDVEVTLMVGNQGSLPWQGEVHSTVPWLIVEPEALLCEPGHFVPLTAVLDTAAFEAGGEWMVENAVQILGQGEERSIATHVALVRPQLAVARRSLDFGLIGREKVATLPLEIENVGTGDLHWQLEWPTKGQNAWLEVSPASGICRAGETAVAQVRAYALAVEGQSGQAWVTVHSNAGRADLPAAVALSAPRLVVEPLTLDLGISENYAPLSQTLRVSNRGVGRLQGTVTARLPWLRCRPEAFDCASGASVQIEVQARPEGLREGDHTLNESLLVESNCGSEEIGVRLTVALVPRLYLSS
ncbi:MAG: protein kinase, partial [Anaerolineae bacterium]